jgi:hypothetical protein
MARHDIAYVVQTCRRDFYLLDLHFTLLGKNGARIQWPKYVLCTDDAHYSQQANFYEKYPGISSIQSLDQIPANIEYISLTHSGGFLQEASWCSLLEKGAELVCSGDESISYGGMYLFRRKNHNVYLGQGMSLSLHGLPYRAVDGSLQKWVKELAAQENVFLDEAFS